MPKLSLRTIFPAFSPPIVRRSLVPALAPAASYLVKKSSTSLFPVWALTNIAVKLTPLEEPLSRRSSVWQVFELGLMM